MTTPRRAEECVEERDDFVCTLPAEHAGQHEAWTCSCAGGGGCVEATSLAETWP